MVILKNKLPSSHRQAICKAILIFRKIIKTENMFRLAMILGPRVATSIEYRQIHYYATFFLHKMTTKVCKQLRFPYIWSHD